MLPISPIPADKTNIIRSYPIRNWHFGCKHVLFNLNQCDDNLHLENCYLPASVCCDITELAEIPYSRNTNADFLRQWYHIEWWRNFGQKLQMREKMASRKIFRHFLHWEFYSASCRLRPCPHVSGNLWKRKFFLRIWLASTRIQNIFRPCLEIFENALQSGNFFMRYEYVYM